MCGRGKLACMAEKDYHGIDDLKNLFSGRLLESSFEKKQYYLYDGQFKDS